MDFREIQKLDFDKPDTDTFKCLDLSFKAMNVGGTLPAIMNAANEIAVDKFLHGECTFLDIADIVEKTMDQAQNKSSELVAQVESLDQLIEIDSWAREFANNL